MPAAARAHPDRPLRARRSRTATSAPTTSRSIAEALDAAKDGFARLAWDLVAGEGESELNAQAVSVRCLQRQDGSMPESEDEGGLICLVAKSY